MSTLDSIYNLTPGIYTVTVEETGGCIEYWEFEIIEPPLLTLDTFEVKNPTCFGGSDGYIYLNGEGGIPPYIFNDDSGWGPDSNYVDLSADVYNFTIQDGYGCQKMYEVTLIDPEEILVDAGLNATIEFGGFTSLNASSSASALLSVTWTPEDGLSCIDCLDPVASPEFTTTYIVTIMDEDSCIAYDDIVVTVELNFVVPNAFTPNNDGLNDAFSIHVDFLLDSYLEIYDRWGELIYTTTDIEQGWNGMHDDKPEEINTYIYNLKATTVNGTEIQKTGTVILLR